MAGLFAFRPDQSAGLGVYQSGAFFGALHDTGFYYQFIGGAQLLAGLLLLFPRTAAVGAILYLCLIVNIFVITVSVDFGRGTPTITGLMLLAWEYPRWKFLLQEPCPALS